jgi:hypothetical protein
LLRRGSVVLLLRREQLIEIRAKLNKLILLSAIFITALKSPDPPVKIDIFRETKIE